MLRFLGSGSHLNLVKLKRHYVCGFLVVAVDA